MKEVFEKIRARLEREYDYNNKKKKEAYEEKDWEVFDIFTNRNEGIYTALAIVNQVAEEYSSSEIPNMSDGWIPCSDGMPDTEHISGTSETVLVTTTNNAIFTAEYHSNGIWLDDVADWSLDVIAWMPLPEPYKPKGEQ